MVSDLLLAMLAMLLTAVSYGRLSALYPSAGSAYTYVGRGLNAHAGFLVGWAMFLGYLVVPSDLVDVVTATLSITSRHAPLIDQAILADFLVEGHFARHVRRMREIYAERLAVLMESAQAHLAGLLTISGLEAGLQTAAWVADGIDAQAAARAAAVRDVEVTPLAWYTRGRRPRVIRQGLHLGFAAVDVPEIRRGVRDLARALESLS